MFFIKQTEAVELVVPAVVAAATSHDAISSVVMDPSRGKSLG